MSYLNPHTHNLDGPHADGTIRTIAELGPTLNAATVRDGLDVLLGDRPRIVCLCGSTRFGQAFRDANFQETLAGRIVLSIGCDTKSDDELWADPIQAAKLKVALDELHKRKIDLADEVYVLNVDGYVGSSTNSEIEYAKGLGKPVRYLEPLW